MQPDPDVLAIIRRRRQAGRCAACGTDAGRAALCAVCQATMRYCSNCEAVWTLVAPRPSDEASKRASAWCPDCKRAERGSPSRAVYLARMKAQRHPKLRLMIALYREGFTMDAIAQQLGMPRGTLGAVISHARATGRWPRSLWRTPRGIHAKGAHA